jgi:outer membrane lipoprotein carrier protein
MRVKYLIICALYSVLKSQVIYADIKKIPALTANKKIVPAVNNIQKLADAVQKYYDKTNSAIITFTQNYKHPYFPTNETSKGKVFFKAKAMLWRYEEPKNRQKEFYIIGNKFTYYLINDKIAYTHNCFDQDTLSASITFLWGKGRLKESFIIGPYTGTISAASTLSWLTLSPKEKNAPIKSISLGVDPKTGMVKESIVIDPSDGTNHFVFSDLKTNIPIAAATFNFVAKPGVRVEPMPNISCPKTSVKTIPAPSVQAPKKLST